MCQQGGWALKGVNTSWCANKRVDWGVPHRLEKGTSVSEDARSWRGVDCEIPHRLGRRTKHFFIRAWKPLPSTRVLKILRGSPKGKVLYNLFCFSFYLAPLEDFTIIKLKCENSNRVQLNWPSPEFGLKVAISPKLPPSPFAMARYQSRVVTHLHKHTHPFSNYFHSYPIINLHSFLSHILTFSEKNRNPFSGKSAS